MEKLSYHFSFKHPNNHLIKIDFEISDNDSDNLIVRLPKWRPGRYELGNFAKNILSMRVFGRDELPLKFFKTNSHEWQIKSMGHSNIRIEYAYYAADLNAGSSYLDSDQLYVNPVNCCLFIPDRISEPCCLHLSVPEKWTIASALKTDHLKNFLHADNFDQLADSPFICSSSLKHDSFVIGEQNFHIWFQGLEKINWTQIRNDFSLFCGEQLSVMGPLPGKDYHFLFQILPSRFYHGVEHLHSTVCALGPAEQIFGRGVYNELLGLSSHELFHAWNIKSIRPEDMWPYDFSQENYSRLGWIYEGFTTYYGDQFLIRSGVFDADTFLDTFNEKLKKHFESYGRFNQPVSEASFDTWLDGYVPGIPNRKTSIYTEGSLCAFMLDMLIREHSSEKNSLDTLMQQLNGYAISGKPYNLGMILEILSGLADYDFTGFYEKYVGGVHDYEPLLEELLERVGLELGQTKPYSAVEHSFGFVLNNSGGNIVISMVAPDSPAEIAGLGIGDMVVACNEKRIKSDLSLAGYTDEITLHYFNKEKLKSIRLVSDGRSYFTARNVQLKALPSLKQAQAWEAWTGQPFPW